MKKVLLLIDQKARDLVSVMLIGEYLREFGIKVYYCNKGNMLAMAENVNPNVLVLSCTEGQYKDLACYLAPQCKIVLMTQEGACATKESTILRHTMCGMGVDSYIKGLSRVYLWSHISKRWLLEESIYPESILRIFGTSRLDAYRQTEKRSCDQTRKIRVGFANRGFSINPTIRSNPIQEIDNFRTKEGSHRAYIDKNREWEDWIWHGMASLRISLDLIQTLAEAGRYEIIFRPDPYENYKSYEFLKSKYPCFHINRDPVLFNFIEDIDVLITEFSTTGTEALLMKKPVISMQKLIGPRLPEHNSLANHINPSHMQFYWQPEDKAALLKVLNDSILDVIPYSPAPEKAENYLKEFYNWPSDGQSVAYCIAKDLQSLLYEEVSSEMNKLHHDEYIEHPFIKRLAQKTHLSSKIVKKILATPVFFDLMNIGRALWRNDLSGHLRAEYYWWQKEEVCRVKNIFQNLKRKDLDYL
ncbi:MAG: hypothetical protein IPJ69_04625 [Deltaproteobacteria bacterium]|nr:MAG: hypothetical protein IPJ69_04625 [Deltaproteobacteria bacterium]